MMMMRCIKKLYSFEVGKIYEATLGRRKGSDMYFVLDINNNPHLVFDEYFISLKEYRTKQLEKIL